MTHKIRAIAARSVRAEIFDKSVPLLLALGDWHELAGNDRPTADYANLILRGKFPFDQAQVMIPMAPNHSK
jgi:hypothetical protein